MAITPSCGFVELWASLLIGIGASICSYFYCYYKHYLYKDLFDDSLDVFECHVRRILKILFENPVNKIYIYY